MVQAAVSEGPALASALCSVLMPNPVPHGISSCVSEQRLGQRHTTVEEAGTIYEEIVPFQSGGQVTGTQESRSSDSLTVQRVGASTSHRTAGLIA